MEIISDKTNKIKTLYHISDIHISKNNDRHKEYCEVFANLYKILKEDIKPDEALIVITGDIIHEKHQLSFSQVWLLANFLEELSSICPIIIILGNHDTITNKSETGNNTIASLINIMKTKNSIHLLLEDKNYIYNNIIFGLTTMHAKKVTPSIQDKTRTKVGLYHGIIYGTKIDDYVLSTYSSFRVNDFMKYYDIVCLGDIHKFSYMNTAKTIAYVGSLIQ